MARPVVLSNGHMHVGINTSGLVHDFYYPHVGFENHASGPTSHHQVGIWVDGAFSWLGDDDWRLRFRTQPTALVGDISATNEALGISLQFDDFVHANSNVFARMIHVINHHDSAREVRLFMHQAFEISNSGNNTDTAQYLPDSNAILHYRGNRVFIASGTTDTGDFFDQHSIGLFGIEGHEGTFRDAEDGELGGANVEHGQVDSVLRFRMNVPAHDSRRVSYWVAAGLSLREALDVHKHAQDTTIDGLLHYTAQWWHEWLGPTLSFAKQLEGVRKQAFIHSAMVLKSHIDHAGAIIASTDSAMLNYARDNYAYSWPRDGAYVLWPLMRLGYSEEALAFFRFCKQALHPQGYLMHKYRADGALGSSWHPYVHGTTNAPPIQEDETALTLFMFLQLYEISPSAELLDEFYDDFIVPAATFVAGYVDYDTGLPKPTYDLWEENFLTTTYTTSVVYAALHAAAELAEAANDEENAVRWRAVANDIQAAAKMQLFNSKRGAFLKGIRHEQDQRIPDETIDLSSFFAAYMFGLFPVSSEETKQARATIDEVFRNFDGPIVPRYENDNYQRVEERSNPWFISSLWLAQYALEINDTTTATNILSWVENWLDQSFMLSEQVSPSDHAPLSVSPLAWSHAEYMATLLDLYKPEEVM